MITTATAQIIEVFSAIQGEGPIVGRRQVFVRFGRCDVKCDYCDTPLCHVELEHCRVEETPGSRDFKQYSNPVSPADILSWIRRLATGGPKHHSVSLTGGEPLLHAPVIAELADDIRHCGLRVYLETNGHLVDELNEVAALVDLIGMDIKLESTTGFPARFRDNRRFLSTALAAGAEVFVKIVVGQGTGDDELMEALSVVGDIAPHLTVVLQPVTPHAGCGIPPEPARLLQMQGLALDRLDEVLVIPQTHKIIGQL